MKKLWLILVEAYINIGFLFYYKKIRAFYLEEIPKDKPVIFLSNHQNALLDPLLITVNSTRKNYFLTRADVFTNKTIAILLKSLQMIPVYRLRDGIRTITKNKKIFSYCSEVLKNKKSIILFPEGNHSLKRTVRSLSKGFTRIIDDYLKIDNDQDLVIIPVGLNYQTPTEINDKVSIYFGRSIDPYEFVDSNKVLDIQALKIRVQDRLKELTTHIEANENYEETIKRLNKLKVDFTYPKQVNDCVTSGFEYSGDPVNKNSAIYKIFRFLTILLYFFPYLIWKIFVSPKIVEDEFIGTLRFAVMMTLAPIYLIITTVLISILIGQLEGMVFVFLGLIIPLITSKIK